MCLKSLVNHRTSNTSGLMEEVHALVLGPSETQFHCWPLSLPVSSLCCQHMCIPKMLSTHPGGAFSKVMGQIPRGWTLSLAFKALCRRGLSFATSPFPAPLPAGLCDRL